jgi:hypothetical protein
MHTNQNFNLKHQPVYATTKPTKATYQAIPASKGASTIQYGAALSCGFKPEKIHVDLLS